MTLLLIYWRCKTIKNVVKRTNYKFLMINRSKLQSVESKFKCNKTLEEWHYKTSRNKYENEKTIKIWRLWNYFLYTASYIS